MKKYALILAVALLASPAFAAVEIIITDADGSGPGLVANVSYNCTAGENVAAFALDISVDAGTIDEVNDFHVGVSTSTAPGYGIFPANFDRYITVNGDGDVDDWGVTGYTPVADVNDKGAAGGLGSAAVTIELGALYKDDANKPASSGLLCTLTCSDNCLMSAVTNSIRGNVVLADATEATVDLTGATNVVISGECYPSTDPAYADWVALGKPECWCLTTQCHGDADGQKEGSAKTGYYRVHFEDLNTLLAGWNTLEPATGTTPSGPGITTVTYGSILGVCADFAHDQEGGPKTGYYRVHFNDLNILIASWNILEPATGTTPSGPGIPQDCPGNIAPTP